MIANAVANEKSHNRKGKKKEEKTKQNKKTSNSFTDHLSDSMCTIDFKQNIRCGVYHRFPVPSILDYFFSENKEICDARTFWWETRDSQAALRKFPTYCFIERTILHGLISHGKSDYLAALKKVNCILN